MLVQTKSLVPCSLGSCRRGALVSPFMLVRTRSFGVLQFRLLRTRSIGVAFYARADQELCAMQFRLMWARRILVPFAVSTRAGNERLLSPFMLVQTMSVWWLVNRSERVVPHNLHSKEP
ncbi:hypothetical protein EV2_013326 [Malus domestica]